MPQPEDEFRVRLIEEADSWVRDGLIDEEQAAAIKTRYTPPSPTGEKPAVRRIAPGKLITALSILGALLLGLGVILFFASNWQNIPKTVKLLLIFGAVISSYHIGYRMTYVKQNYPRVGGALIFLGAMLYGAGIWLIAQIYNISAHYPDGILLWAVGVLPVAYVISSAPILYLGLLLFTLWLSVETLLFNITYYDIRLYEIIGMYVLYGVFLYSLGVLHSQTGRLKSLKTPYLVLGALTVLLVTYPLTFESFSELYAKYNQEKGLSELWVGIPILFSLALLSIILNLAYRKSASPVFMREMAGVTFVLLIGAFIILYPKVAVSYAVSNTVFLALVLGVIAAGYYNGIGALINVGTFFFGVEVITRYFDFFWDLLPKSIFFIMGGLILLFGGMHLERKRRRIMEDLRHK